MEPQLTFLATCSALPAAEEGNVPEWLMLVPAGVSQGVDGRGPYHNDQPDAVVANSMQGGRPIAFDYNHQTVFAALNGSPSPASGWIDKLETRDGAIWGHVDWTPAGRMAVQSAEYRYISPAFHHDAKGRVTRLVSAGLVNMPNLRELPAIHAQIRAIFPQTNGDPVPMDKALQDRLAAALGVSTATSVEALVAHAETNRTVATGAYDPSKYVPIEAFTELQLQVSTLSSNAASTHAANLVDAAAKSGKLTPAMREWGFAYASQNPTGFEAWVAAAPPVVAPGADPAIPKDEVSAHASGLTTAELAVCAQFNLTPEAYVASKKAA